MTPHNASIQSLSQPNKFKHDLIVLENGCPYKTRLSISSCIDRNQDVSTMIALVLVRLISELDIVSKSPQISPTITRVILAETSLFQQTQLEDENLVL